MKNIVLIPNPNKDNGLSLTAILTEKLISLGAVVYIEDKYAEYVPSAVHYASFPEEGELIIVVGGDGSVIDASVFAVEHDIPLLGVNLGKVGYLSEVEPDNTDILERLFSGEYTVAERMLLSVSRGVGDEAVTFTRFAVNDVIITREDFLGISDFTLENSRGERVKYRADGMILSTPLGSTAYSLSAGGPIVAHSIPSILATPICPHSFFNRAIIFPPDECIKIKNISESVLNVSVDGRCLTSLSCLEECSVRVADKRLKLLTFNENNMFSTLFKKMRILEDIK